ncbi:MAG TPA: DUF349 domain-containing protein, partial [Telluria sp.]
MFEFLFKRPGDKPAESPAGQAAPAQADGAKPATPTTAAREQQAHQVAGLRGDEAGAADFILQCDFSELRLAAAEFVHSREQLERVHAGIRNTDRRVAKLMQARLDAIRHHDAEVGRGQACIAQAETLLRDERLTPNLVADLDHAWAIIKAPELAPRFDALRARLGQRLEAQVALQRAMIDRLGQIRKLGTSDVPATEIAAQLRQIDQDQQQALAAPEHASLPRSLTNEVANEMVRVSSSLADLAQGQSAIARRDALLAEWQGVAPESLNADLLNKAWRQLPPVPEPAAAQLRQRFDELLATLPVTVNQPAAPKARKNAPSQAPDQGFIDKVEAMEAALQHGSLGAAAELDKALKDSKGVRLSAELADR